MSLHVFNNSQELIGVISTSELFALEQNVEINKTDTLYAEVSTKRWVDFEEKPFYLAVKDSYEDFAYHLYKISNEDLDGNTTAIQGVNVAFDELKAKGYIQDRRFAGNAPRVAFDAVVEGTDWEVTYIDSNLPKVTTNFYYISRLEALGKLVNHLGVELRFRVHVSGNKISSKRIEVYKQLSEFKGKRFTYGSNLLQVIKEEDGSELYTALVGRGKGEELEDEQGNPTGEHGRRITFEDVEWKKSSGHPVDKPLGQEFVDIPERTKLYGYPDGSPRIGIVEYEDIEDTAELLQKTYDNLLEVSRPKVQFKALVETAGDMALGETVAIIRPDIDLRYKTRVFKIKRNLLNDNYSEVEFGDKLTQSMSERISDITSNVDSEIDRVETIIQDTASGKNKIFRSEIEPVRGMAVGDLWYKTLENGEVEVYQYDGEMWRLIIGAGVNAEVKKAIKEAEQVAKDAQENVGDIAMDLEEGTSFFNHANRIGLADKNPDGTIESIITIGKDGPYIGGKNIVLDGKTITNDFVVTGEMLADSAVVDNLSGQKLDFADITAVNLDVSAITGETSDFVKSAWNSVSNKLTIDGDGITFTNYNSTMMTEIKNSRIRILHGEIKNNAMEYTAVNELSKLVYPVGTSPFKMREGSGIFVPEDSYYMIGSADISSNPEEPRSLTRIFGVSGAGDVLMNRIKPIESNKATMEMASTTGGSIRLRNAETPRSENSYTGIDLTPEGDVKINNGSKLITKGIYGQANHFAGLIVEQISYGDYIGTLLRTNHPVPEQRTGILFSWDGSVYAMTGGWGTQLN